MGGIVMNKNTLQITQTGLLIALIVVAQAVGTAIAPAVAVLGLSVRQLVTGSLVNLVLCIAAAKLEFFPAITVGLFSPVMAQLLGISGRPEFLPVLVLGNVVLVCILFFGFAASRKKPAHGFYYLVPAAVCKMGVMWLLTALVIVPGLASGANPPPQQQVDFLTLQFSWPQGITATAGCLLAMAILPAIRQSSSEYMPKRHYQ